MPKFYFTYGSEGHPYVGGWTEIIAPDEEIARGVFRGIHPNPDSDLLKCSSVYSEEQFKQTSMYRNGNMGAYCHEEITVHVEGMVRQHG